MPAKKSDKTVNQNDVMKQLEPLSKVLSKSVSQIWKIFVMRYIARGIGEIFLAVAHVLIVHSYFGYNKGAMLVSLTIATVLIYDAIQILVNPHYFAMNDVAVRVKSEQAWLKASK